MTTNNEMGQIIPFNQGAEFYLRKGRGYLEQNEYVNALKSIRKAYLMGRGNVETSLALAEVLNRMQRFEESTRVLLMIDAEKTPSEVLFGLANNYIAMEEFEPAKACLEQYISANTEGAFVDEAEDLLDLLEDETELALQIGLPQTDDVHLIEDVHYAKSLHFCELDKDAKKYLTDIEQEYPDSIYLQTEIALLQLNLKEYVEAEQRLFGLLKMDSKNTRVLCLLALVQYTQGRIEDAEETMSRVVINASTSLDDLGHAASLYIELQQYNKAVQILELMLKIMPYDKLALHQMALCKYQLDDRIRSCQIYQTLVDMDETDTVAAFYLKLVKGKDSKLKKRFMTSYEVPYTELVSRLKYIRDSFNRSEEETKNDWATDAELRGLLRWSLFSQISPIRTHIIQTLGSMDDDESKYLLREFLLRMDVPDSAKSVAAGALSATGFHGSFCIYMSGKWQFSVMDTLNIPQNLIPSYERVLEIIVSEPDKQSLPKNTTQFATRIFFYYYSVLGDDVKGLNHDQIQSMAAGFILMALHAQQDSRTADDICDMFGISMRRLNNALTKIFTALDKGEEEPKCDS